MLSRVKGTNDFYPPEMAVLQYVLGTMANTCVRYGFQYVMTPAIETLKTLTAKSGEDVKKQIFVLEKKSAEELGLKFDLTVPMTRMFVAKQRELPKPVKWFAVDRMWRYEAPQAGREREFFQISVENFGSDKPETDAEIINLCIDCLLATGLAKNDFVLKISHRKLLEGILIDIIPKNKLEDAMRIIDKKNKLEDKQFFDEMKKAGIDNTRAERIFHATSINGSIKDVEKKIRQHIELNELAQEGLRNLREILSMVHHSNITIDLSVARGLAYYTGCVFEAFDAQGKFRALGAGGRYDQLVQLFGGENCPATGFAIGYSTANLLLKEKKKLNARLQGPDFYIAPVNEAMIPSALTIARQLRNKYSVEADLMRRSISKQFDYANKIGAKYVLVVGPEELKTKKFTIKEMKTGKETKKTISELLG